VKPWQSIFRFKFLAAMATGKMQRSLRLFMAALLSATMAIAFTPRAASAISWWDLIRVAPAAIQVIQISNLSDANEVKLGQNIDQEISREVRFSRDPMANELVRSLGQELVPYSDRPNIPYTFRVVDDESINAFATMGGFVYINTGLIAAADNRAQLAGVIAHEIGHITGKHALEQVKQAAIAQGVATIAGVDDNRLVQIGAVVALQLPNSREAEYDADRRGLFNLAKAGYAPQAMPDFMQKLVNKSNGVPEFLSTHPAPVERVRNLNEMIAQNNLVASGGLNNTNYQRRWRNRFN
jgi:predicted Zn-dependent protease